LTFAAAWVLSLHCHIFFLLPQVTLQSFLWSPRVAEKGNKAKVEALIQHCQGQLQEAPGVSGLADLARTTPADVASVMVRASSGAGGTVDASVKRVIIGKVRVCYVLGWLRVDDITCHYRNTQPRVLKVRK
jgi:hypothetical protein